MFQSETAREFRPGVAEWSAIGTSTFQGWGIVKNQGFIVKNVFVSHWLELENRCGT